MEQASLKIHAHHVQHLSRLTIRELAVIDKLTMLKQMRLVMLVSDFVGTNSVTPSCFVAIFIDVMS